MLYHKIQSVFKRNPEDDYKTFLMGEWADPTFGYLADLEWAATEKVDGTNMRLHVGFDGEYVIGGRSERAEIHTDLRTHMEDIGDRCFGLAGLTLYGEGYGAGIQKGGGRYGDDKGFILFDVAWTETGMFLKSEDVRDIAWKLGLPVVSTMWSGTLTRAIDHFLQGRLVTSRISEGEAEGWVLRPQTELRNRWGERVITKLKVKDFPERASHVSSKFSGTSE
jgi:hypothetical protein